LKFAIIFQNETHLLVNSFLSQYNEGVHIACSSVPVRTHFGLSVPNTTQ
jgi:hypothetical protein